MDEDCVEKFSEDDRLIDKSSQNYDSLKLYFKCISSFPVLI